MLDLQECLCWDKTAKLPKLGANLPIQTLTETLGDLHRNTVATNTVAHQHTKTSATNTATSDKATLC